MKCNAKDCEYWRDEEDCPSCEIQSVDVEGRHHTFKAAVCGSYELRKKPAEKHPYPPIGQATEEDLPHRRINDGLAAKDKQGAEKPPTMDSYEVLLQCQNCGMLAFAVISAGHFVSARSKTVPCPHCQCVGTLMVCLNWWTAPINESPFPDKLPEFDWTK